MFGEERRGHGTRLVKVEVNLHSVLAGALHHPVQIGQPGLPARPEVRISFGRSEVAEHRLEPHSTNARTRQFFHETVRKWVNFRLHQGVAVKSEVGIDVARAKLRFPPHCALFEVRPLATIHLVLKVADCLAYSLEVAP